MEDRIFCYVILCSFVEDNFKFKVFMNDIELSKYGMRGFLKSFKYVVNGL